MGLFLAIYLIRNGVQCRVLEKRPYIDQHSKSFGIHPVSLELFEEMDIAALFVHEGLKIFRGHAFSDNRKVGTVSFKNCPLPFNYILSLPQYQTEKILENTLKKMDPGCLLRGADVRNLRQHHDSVTVTYHMNGDIKQMNSYWLVGCDGKNSLVRKKTDIEFHGKMYPDTYIMGDYTDNTQFDSDAAVYLHRNGLIECFPLPGKQRRWVVKTKRYIENPVRKTVDKLVKERLNFDITQCDLKMVSSFGVQHFQCSRFYQNRVLLAGDSAHVVSPIGGQGMNLGWITARNLGQTLVQIMKKPGYSDRFLRAFSGQSQKIVVQVARRAEFNMRLGRSPTFPALQRLLIRGLVNTPVRSILARIFTMRGLGKWPV